MIYLGDYLAEATVRFFWPTNGGDGASITRATNGSLRIYKDASTTQRSSSAGITDTEDFDSLTGVHLCAIDLSDDTDAGFYAAGHDYAVMLQGAVIDGKAVNTVLAHFSIENRGDALAKRVHTIGTSVYEEAVKAAPKCLGAAVIMTTHQGKDDAAGNFKWEDAAGSYAGTNALSRPIVATDSALVAVKEVGDLA